MKTILRTVVRGWAATLFFILCSCAGETISKSAGDEDGFSRITPQLAYLQDPGASGYAHQLLFFRDTDCQAAQDLPAGQTAEPFELPSDLTYTLYAVATPGGANLAFSRPQPGKYLSRLTDYVEVVDMNAPVPDLMQGSSGPVQIVGNTPSLHVTLGHVGAVVKAAVRVEGFEAGVDSILLTIGNLYDRIQLDGTLTHSGAFRSKQIRLLPENGLFTNVAEADSIFFPSDAAASRLDLTYTVCLAGGLRVERKSTPAGRLESGKVYLLETTLTLHEAVQVATQIRYATWGSVVLSDQEIELTHDPVKKLPRVYVTTDDGDGIYSKEEYETGSVRIDGRGAYPGFEGTMKIRGRGNTSWFFPKKPYRMKLTEKASLLDLSSAKDWLFISNYTDPTLMLNAVAFETARYLGLRFTNHVRHVELYINGAYRGIYLFTEQIQVDKSRVNIDKTNGFLVELDDYFDAEGEQFRSEIFYLPVMVKSPEITAESDMDFVREAIDDMERLVQPATVASGAYREKVDVASLIGYLLVNELTANSEILHPKSVYLFRDAGGKIEFGPVWDYDWGFSYTGVDMNYFGNHKWVLDPDAVRGQWAEGYDLFYSFFKDPAFVRDYKARWNAVKSGVVAHILAYIDEQRKLLAPGAPANFERWEQTCDFERETERLKSWFRGQVDYLDSRINGL